MNIKDVHRLPQHIIHLSTMEAYSEISQFGKLHQIKYYTYAFLYMNLETIKYGMSVDSEWEKGKWLNRAYRQAGYIPGWTQEKPRSANGYEMERICEDHFPLATKDNVTLIIYDMTHYPFIDKNRRDQEVRGAEDALIRNFTELYQRKPYGNHNNSISNGPDNSTFRTNFIC